MSGARTTLRKPLHEIMSKQTSSLDIQRHEANFGTEWMWNTVSEEMEKSFGTSYMASRKLWIMDRQMTWKELPQLTTLPNGSVGHGRDDKEKMTSQ